MSEQVSYCSANSCKASTVATVSAQSRLQTDISQTGCISNLFFFSLNHSCVPAKSCDNDLVESDPFFIYFFILVDFIERHKRVKNNVILSIDRKSFRAVFILSNKITITM